MNGTMQYSDAAAGANYVRREADLFAAGSYPERGVNVTEADLVRLAGTVTNVPVNIAHEDGHCEAVGFVSGLKVAGKWLKGTLNLLPEADALFRKIGMKGVSVGVLPTLDRLVHVGVTSQPRVMGAQMFSGVLSFSMGQAPTDPTLELLAFAREHGHSEALCGQVVQWYRERMHMEPTVAVLAAKEYLTRSGAAVEFARAHGAPKSAVMGSPEWYQETMGLGQQAAVEASLMFAKSSAGGKGSAPGIGSAEWYRQKLIEAGCDSDNAVHVGAMMADLRAQRARR